MRRRSPIRKERIIWEAALVALPNRLTIVVAGAAAILGPHYADTSASIPNISFLLSSRPGTRRVSTRHSGRHAPQQRARRPKAPHPAAARPCYRGSGIAPRSASGSCCSITRSARRNPARNILHFGFLRKLVVGALHRRECAHSAPPSVPFRSSAACAAAAGREVPLEEALPCGVGSAGLDLFATPARRPPL